jgi:hypothetical protein
MSLARLEFREQERSVAGAWISTVWAGSYKSISNPQQILPLVKLAIRAQALGNLEA